MINYLLVGQGLAGSVLAYKLRKKGYSVHIIDKFNPNSSSQVAAGLVNPVTGRRIVKSWMADLALPFAFSFYKEVEVEFGQQFFFPVDALEVVGSVHELNEWTRRAEEQDRDDRQARLNGYPRCYADDRDDAQGVALIGAGEEDFAADVGERRPDSGSGQAAADLGVGGTALAHQLLTTGLGLGRVDRCIGAFAHPGQFADHAGRQDRGELGHVLFAVVADQAHVERRVGLGVVVERSRFELGLEGRHATRWAGSTSDSLGDLERGAHRARVGRV